MSDGVPEGLRAKLLGNLAEHDQVMAGTENALRLLEGAKHESADRLVDIELVENQLRHNQRILNQLERAYLHVLRPPEERK